MRRVVQGALVLWLVLVMVVLRVGYGAWQSYEDGMGAMAAGNLPQARLSLEAAAHWYLPGLSWSGDALIELKSLATMQEEAGDVSQALGTYQVMRSALLGTRSYFNPDEALLLDVNERIAQIRGTDKRALWPWTTLPQEKRLQEARRVLAHDSQPSTGWSLVTVLAYLGWILGAVGLIFLGFDRGGKLQIRQAIQWSFVVGISYGLWVLGMASA